MVPATSVMMANYVPIIVDDDFRVINYYSRNKYDDKTN